MLYLILKAESEPAGAWTDWQPVDFCDCCASAGSILVSDTPQHIINCLSIGSVCIDHVHFVVLLLTVSLLTDFERALRLKAELASSR